MYRQNGGNPMPGYTHNKPPDESTSAIVSEVNLRLIKTNKVTALFKTVRPLSSLVTGVLTVSAAVIGQGRLSFRGMGAGLTMLALSMFGFTMNDVLDYRQDRAAGIRRPVAAGELSRKNAVWLAFALLLATFLFSLIAGPGKTIPAIAGGLLLIYSPLKKRYPLCKDVYVAGLCCLPLYYGITVGGRQCPWFSYAALACFVLGREIWMDSDEMPGDCTSGVRTVGAVVGRQETQWIGKGLMVLAAAALAAVAHGLIAVLMSAASFISLVFVFAWPGLNQSRRIGWSRGPMLLGAIAIACTCV
jgi:geranylgeranylglycerol-phosphate geranylgeranyltransferase